MAIPDDSEILATISVKVPRWVEDAFRLVAADTGLKPGEATRTGLIALARIFQKHWRRGPALEVFLEQLKFDPQGSLFFVGRKGK